MTSGLARSWVSLFYIYLPVDYRSTFYCRNPRNPCVRVTKKAGRQKQQTIKDLVLYVWSSRPCYMFCDLPGLTKQVYVRAGLSPKYNPKCSDQIRPRAFFFQNMFGPASGFVTYNRGSRQWADILISCLIGDWRSHWQMCDLQNDAIKDSEQIACRK